MVGWRDSKTRRRGNARAIHQTTFTASSVPLAMLISTGPLAPVHVRLKGSPGTTVKFENVNDGFAAQELASSSSSSSKAVHSRATQPVLLWGLCIIVLVAQ